MPRTQEDESLVAIGRQVAEDATQLVRAELAVAKAHALATLVEFAIGIGAVIAGALSAFLFFIFTIATLCAGNQAIDSWPLYASAGGALVAIGGFAVASGMPRWLALPLRLIAGIGALAFVVGLIMFLVVAIIGGNDEVGRRGWAIAATSFFGLTVLAFAAGGFVIYRGVRGTTAAVRDIKEDAAWVKRLTKRNAAES